MKIDCLKGFFLFRELKVGQVSDFMRWSGLDLVKVGDYYTFAELETVPEYSITGNPLLNLIAIKTYEGTPWDIFEQNAVCFNFLTGLLVPFASVVQSVKLSQAGNYYISNGLIVPGSILPNGKKILSYSGYFSRDTLNFYYSEVESV